VYIQILNIIKILAIFPKIRYTGKEGFLWYIRFMRYVKKLIKLHWLLMKSNSAAMQYLCKQLILETSDWGLQIKDLADTISDLWACPEFTTPACTQRYSYRGADKSLARPNLKTIQTSPFFVRRGYRCCRGDLVGRTTFWTFFLSGLQ